MTTWGQGRGRRPGPGGPEQSVDGDIERYVAAKAALVAELLARARAERGLPPVTYWAP